MGVVVEGPGGAGRVDADRPAEAEVSAEQRLATLIKYGSDVDRWHTVRCHHYQTIAEHSWGVALLISKLFKGKPHQRLALIEAALDHDLAEGLVGDMPRFSRVQEHKDLEHAVGSSLGLRHIPLDPSLSKWLDFADIIDASLYAHREHRLGNGNFEPIVKAIAEALTRQLDDMPPELQSFVKENKLI